MINFIYIIIFVLCFYTISIFKIMFSPKHRVTVKLKNDKLNTLRKIDVKTIEEQKEFINTKYQKNHFNSKSVIDFFVHAVCFFLLYKVYFHLFGNYSPGLLFTLAFVILFPLTINWILKLFNLNGDDVSVFFRK